ncbi:NUDIX hydrolase [Rubrivirga marina]|uniref:Nudix hydrolase domain-containing protein n=1 Tax=Rubrivirga marina TaxID=1196024 RepID=A0A271J539_9BACT|nr:NUDIX hydrolase [Rubrivirga marina]PAP77799.1 hypothetical protein BSZ37_15780 [Rubrivirga marina]
MSRQCAAVPFRLGPDGPEVLLVTSRTRGRWIVPKGNVESAGARETAALEAFEEAGVTGCVGPRPFGCYHHDGDGLVDVFLLAVEVEHAVWPERGIRERRWVRACEAAATAEVTGLRPILDAAAARIGPKTRD